VDEVDLCCPPGPSVTSPVAALGGGTVPRPHHAAEAFGVCLQRVAA
jgi:hypothetical protein